MKNREIWLSYISFLISFRRFVPEKFEAIFSKHALTQQQALTSDELQKFLKSNREPKDYGGWYVNNSFFEIFHSEFELRHIPKCEYINHGFCK